MRERDQTFFFDHGLKPIDARRDSASVWIRRTECDEQSLRPQRFRMAIASPRRCKLYLANL
jgi:hypothetical protein